MKRENNNEQKFNYLLKNFACINQFTDCCNKEEKCVDCLEETLIGYGLYTTAQMLSFIEYLLFEYHKLNNQLENIKLELKENGTK